MSKFKFWAVQVEDSENKKPLMDFIRERDMFSVFDTEGNPITFWVSTQLDLALLREVCEFPFDAIQTTQ